MPPKTKPKTPLYKAQEELDSIWEKLFEEHVVLNEEIIHFFAGPESEKLYTTAYILAIAETNEKYDVVLTKASYDTMRNNVFQKVSIQSYRTDFEKLGWAELYPKEMKAAHKRKPSKFIEPSDLVIGNDIIVELDII